MFKAIIFFFYLRVTKIELFSRFRPKNAVNIQAEGMIFFIIIIMQTLRWEKVKSPQKKT